ncbi:hypothetical protein FGG08_006420, partial [Glutinoglossum americanum]
MADASIKERARLGSSISSSLIGQLSSSGPLNLSSALPSTASVTPSSSAPPLELGPYVCNSSINVSIFTSLLLDYIQQTENTLDAHLLYVIINMHAAASTSSASRPAPQPKSLPLFTNLLGTIFGKDLSPYMYTPTLLRAERQDLNQSWYKTDSLDSHYFAVQILPGDIHSTLDGWPNEAHIEFSHGRRLLVGWGSVDPQMSRYNFTGDEGTIFPRGELEDERGVSSVSSGRITGGCVFNPNTTELAKTNSSWAISRALEGPYSTTEELDSVLNLATSLVSCGISPALNTTILGSTAFQDPTRYLDFSYRSTWSWEPDQPQNSSHSDPSSPSSSLFRCAAIDPTATGRWRVDDCSQHYYAACRIGSRPYDWQIADYTTTYSFANQACPPGSTFSVPRTGLENAYLWQKLLDRGNADRAGAVWIDFNSMETEGCWVTGGPNATCPYFDDTDTERRRTVLVPVIAAIIIFVVAGLTMFVKCNANRRVSRRRRRVEGGWEYEG